MHDQCNFFDSHTFEGIRSGKRATVNGNRMSIGFLSTGQFHNATRRDTAPRVTLRARLAARLFAARYDRMLAVGVPVAAGSALAVHADRLASIEEREAIARVLRRSVGEARDRGSLMSSRVALNLPNISAAEDRIDQVTLR